MLERTNAGNTWTCHMEPANLYYSNLAISEKYYKFKKIIYANK